MITAKVILEIFGSPKEHVEKTLNLMLDQIDTKEGLKLIKKEVFPPEKKEDMFASFAELEVSFDNITSLYEFCFYFMPSFIDILEPDELSFDTKTFSDSLNDLLATIHQQDMHLKNSNAKVKILTKNISSLLNNFIRFLTETPISAEDLSTKLGIPKTQLITVLKNMENEGKLIKEKDLWRKK